jgi:hypothetical protein
MDRTATEVAMEINPLEIADWFEKSTGVAKAYCAEASNVETAVENICDIAQLIHEASSLLDVDGIICG